MSAEVETLFRPVGLAERYLIAESEFNKTTVGKVEAVAEFRMEGAK